MERSSGGVDRWGASLRRYLAAAAASRQYHRELHNNQINRHGSRDSTVRDREKVQTIL